MRKKNSFLLLLLCSFVLIGCTPTYEQRVQQRIDEYADEIYLTFWGDEYKDVELPEKLVYTRNEFNEAYSNKLRKVIFITDSFTALNLKEEDLIIFAEKIEKDFNIYFYDYNKPVITEFVKKFGISTDNLPNGCNYFFCIKNYGISSFSYSNTNANPISNQTILTTILERMTH